MNVLGILSLPILAILLISCHPQTEDCPAYCEGVPGGESLAAIHDKCVAAFGDGYSVAIRTCPRGLVPAACASLSEHSGETIQCDPGDTQPDDILCCWE